MRTSLNYDSNPGAEVLLRELSDVIGFEIPLTPYEVEYDLGIPESRFNGIKRVGAKAGAGVVAVGLAVCAFLAVDTDSTGYYNQVLSDQVAMSNSIPVSPGLHVDPGIYIKREDIANIGPGILRQPQFFNPDTLPAPPKIAFPNVDPSDDSQEDAPHEFIGPIEQPTSVPIPQPTTVPAPHPMPTGPPLPPRGLTPEPRVTPHPIDRPTTPPIPQPMPAPPPMPTPPSPDLLPPPISQMPLESTPPPHEDPFSKPDYDNHIVPPDDPYGPSFDDPPSSPNPTSVPERSPQNEQGRGPVRNSDV